MNEFFDITLPGTLEKYNLVLDFFPHFGDFARREFIRIPLELRYGLKTNWEIYTGFTPFAPNPFDGGPDRRWGPGLFKLGARYDLKPVALFYQDVTLGFERIAPLGEPPVDLIDHYVHLRHYVTAARPFPFLADTTFLTTLSHDHAIPAPARGDMPAGVIKRHVTELSPGLLYKLGELGGFVEYTLRRLDEPVGHRLAHAGRVGMLWDAPPARTRRWKLPGKWQFEISYEVSDEEGLEIDHGVNVRVRVKTNLKQILGREKPPAPGN